MLGIIDIITIGDAIPCKINPKITISKEYQLYSKLFKDFIKRLKHYINMPIVCCILGVILK